MPEINRFACDECDFELPVGWGGYCYVTDANGERIVCPHPSEAHTITRVTGMSFGEAMDAGRVGFSSDCVCLTCLRQFPLDLKRDQRVCTGCSSGDVRATSELVDQPCPKCKRGTIKAGSLIRWQLDPDRGSLPVPQVVRDLVAYEKSRQVPASLRQTYEALQRIPGIERDTFPTISVHLLGWWEGDAFGEDQEPRPSPGPYDLKWPWVQGFRLVVEGTPELHRLIRWDNGHWYFRDAITADERRGIKNYVREHWQPPVWS